MAAIMAEQGSDGAPIVQLLLTASFAPQIDNLSVIDLADIYKSFEEEYPVFRQIVRARPMSFTPTQNAPDLSQMVGLPRVAFSTEDTMYQVYFQNDRLSFGWSRTSSVISTSGYPGFRAIFSAFYKHLRAVQQWAQSRGLTIEPAVGEIVYTDAFAFKTDDREGDARASDVFRIMNPDVAFPVLNFDYSWSEALPETLPGYVDGSASGPALSPEGMPVVTLETAAHFDAGSGWDGFSERFEHAHLAVLDIYNRVVNSAARAKS